MTARLSSLKSLPEGLALLALISGMKGQSFTMRLLLCSQGIAFGFLLMQMVKSVRLIWRAKSVGEEASCDVWQLESGCRKLLSSGAKIKAAGAASQLTQRECSSNDGHQLLGSDLLECSTAAHGGFQRARFFTAEKVSMGKRVEWLKSLMQDGRPTARPRQFLILLAFETYYQLCTLRGYRPRHLLDPEPPELKASGAGGQVLLIWPRRLPLSIRALNKVFPFEDYHVELVRYTPEAAAAADASGRRAEMMKTVRGELRHAGTFK